MNDPIPKRLVSFQFNADEQIRLIKEMLADRDEQRAGNDLEPGDALKLVELLDSILKTDRLDGVNRPACVRYLARICGSHRILPNSVQISGCERDSLPHGGGGHSEVLTGKYNGQKVAIKVLKNYEADGPETRRETAKAFCREAVIWKNLEHQNILPFVGAMMTIGKGWEKYELVSEFMENGTIDRFIVQQDKDVNRLELLKDIAVGLKYLHSQRVIHGDLKGQNILINEHRRACLADFGLTRVIGEFTSSGPDNPGGTPGWMSPEVYWPERFEFKNAKPTKYSDVYSLGIVIYEVICGHRPFHELVGFRAAVEMCEGKLPERPEVGFTDSLWETLKRCWNVNRDERPSIEAVLRSLDEASRT